MYALSYMPVTVDGESDDNCFSMRGSHSLTAMPEAARQLMGAVASFPLEEAGNAKGGAAAAGTKLAWHNMAKLVLPHATISGEAAQARTMEVYIKDEALSRLWSAIASLPGVADAAAPMAYGLFHRTVKEALAKTPAATLAAL